MKRYIKADSTKTESILERMLDVCEEFIEVLKADSDEDLAVIRQRIGNLHHSDYDKETLIDYYTYLIERLTSEYKLSLEREKNTPAVKQELENFLINNLGCSFDKLSNYSDEFIESYVLVPADKCTKDDLSHIASAIAKYFNIKPKIGSLGGGLSSYGFSLDGVPFSVGFKRDFDYDPSGEELSLQLGFRKR